MKALIERTTGYGDDNTRVEEINSLEELLELMKKEKNPLIISNYSPWEKDARTDIDFTIEIYDGCRE